VTAVVLFGRAETRASAAAGSCFFAHGVSLNHVVGRALGGGREGIYVRRRGGRRDRRGFEQVGGVFGFVASWSVGFLWIVGIWGFVVVERGTASSFEASIAGVDVVGDRCGVKASHPAHNGCERRPVARFVRG
jgi:hypothetical protein